MVEAFLGGAKEEAKQDKARHGQKWIQVQDQKTN
jgi:hypothetical protein